MSALPPPADSLLWEGRKLMIGLPWYKTTNPRTAFALMAMLDRKRMAVSLDFGDAFVAHSRNKLATGFLQSGLEWLLMVDDDSVPPFGNAVLYNSFTGFELPDEFAGVHGIDRLLSHGKTLVGGMYRGRWPHSKPIFAEGPSVQKWIEEKPRNQLRETKWVGFGFVLIHRSVFLDIEKKFPHLARKEDGTGGNYFTSSEHDLRHAVVSLLDDPEKGMPLDVSEIRQCLRQALETSNRNSNLGVGEDVQFCRRAFQAGHQCYVDLGCVVGHLGEYCYGYGTKKKVL